MKKVITYGTFDLFHRGHYNILKRAKDLGDYLIVGVTSDSFDLDRGKLNVRDSLATRIKNVEQTGLADEIIIEEYQGQKIDDVQKYQVDTFVVGSDWIGKFDYLKEYCNVVYLERTKNISSTQIRSEGAIYRVGVVVDSDVDANLIVETKLVSGLNVEAVYSANIVEAKKFAAEQEIHFYTSDYNEFLNNVDIVYMASDELSSDELVQKIENAIECQKHVICNMSIMRSEADVEKLYSLALENNVYLWDDLPIAYIRAFEQMLWFIKGNAIGKLVSMNMNITVDRNTMTVDSIRKIKYLALFIMNKFMGLDIIEQYTYSKNGYESCYFITSQGEVHLRIGTTCDMENVFEIIGTEGKLIMNDDWWNVRYYRMNKHFSEQKERHCYSFEGNGARYVMHSLLKAIMSGSCSLYKVRPAEIQNIVQVLNIVDKI